MSRRDELLARVVALMTERDADRAVSIGRSLARDRDELREDADEETRERMRTAELAWYQHQDQRALGAAVPVDTLIDAVTDVQEPEPEPEPPVEPGPPEEPGPPNGT